MRGQPKVPLHPRTRGEWTLWYSICYWGISKCIQYITRLGAGLSVFWMTLGKLAPENWVSDTKILLFSAILWASSQAGHELKIFGRCLVPVSLLDDEKLRMIALFLTKDDDRFAVSIRQQSRPGFCNAQFTSFNCPMFNWAYGLHLVSGGFKPDPGKAICFIGIHLLDHYSPQYHG